MTPNPNIPRATPPERSSIATVGAIIGLMILVVLAGFWWGSRDRVDDTAAVTEEPADPTEMRSQAAPSPGAPADVSVTPSTGTGAPAQPPATTGAVAPDGNGSAPGAVDPGQTPAAPASEPAVTAPANP